MSPSGKALDFDSSTRRFESCLPSHFLKFNNDPLAQLAEHLTFNQGVPRSSRGWITNFMERYRSGHNEAVLKTVWAQARVGSNPTLSAIYTLMIACKIKIWRSTQVAEEAPLLRE